MGYTNSPLINHTGLSPNHSGQRTHAIDRITPHCVVGQLTVEQIGQWFARGSTLASSNYGIGRDGRVGLYVEERNRSWCSSSSANDQRAVTIECASDTTDPYAMNDVVYQRLIELCTDICRRNGKRRLLWLGSKEKALSYEPAADEMVLTVHRWFANKACPGDWLYGRLGDLAARVTAALAGSGGADGKSGGGNGVYGSGNGIGDGDGDDASAASQFCVRVTTPHLNIRKGPGVGYARVRYCPLGIYTITEVVPGAGSASGWGRLKSGSGYISLDYCKRL